MKAVVLNPMVCILGWVDHHVLLGGVQHVGHPKALEVGDVAHCLSIPNDDARMHLHTNIITGIPAHGGRRKTTDDLKGI